MVAKWERIVTLADVRDVAIIVLAVESIVVGIVLILLLWQLRSLTRLLQEEIKPMLDSLQQTIGTVKGTTTLEPEKVFVSTLPHSATVPRLPLAEITSKPGWSMWAVKVTLRLLPPSYLTIRLPALSSLTGRPRPAQYHLTKVETAVS